MILYKSQLHHKIYMNVPRIQAVSVQEKGTDKDTDVGSGHNVATILQAKHDEKLFFPKNRDKKERDGNGRREWATNKK